MKGFLKFGGLGVVALLVLILIQCGNNKSTGPKPTPTQRWTILAYADGNNNIDYSHTGASFTIMDVQEMEKVGSSDNVKIVTMLGCMKRSGICRYYYMGKYPNDFGDSISSTVLQDLGIKDMSEPTTLKNFISYGVSQYPADHYVLIIDDHGGGWRGTCSDDQSGGGKMMTLPQLKQALTWTGAPKFDVIIFHACLMSMMEVAYELRQKSNYMVASQFTMPMQSILGSEFWMDYLTKNPNTTDSALAASVVDAIQTAAINKGKTFHAASTDLSKIENVVAKVSNLGLDLPSEAANYWGEVLDAWNKTWTDKDAPDFVDLYQFAVNLSTEEHLKNINIITNEVTALKEAISTAVTRNKTNATGVTRGGLCIWFPWKTSQFTESDSSDYVKLDFQSAQWHNFLSIFVHSLAQDVTGTLVIHSNPSGAEIFVNGTDQQCQTPITFTDVPAASYAIKLTKQGYIDWDSTVQVEAGKTTTVNAVLTPSGGTGASISGTVYYSGHTLSAYVKAYADTLDQSLVPYSIALAQVNPSNGSYTIQISQLASAIELVVEAWDDANNNQEWDSGDGWGFYDANSNGNWDTGDIITLSPGQNLTGINITMHQYTTGSPKISSQIIR
jgi:hypothetical protein